MRQKKMSRLALAVVSVFAALSAGCTDKTSWEREPEPFAIVISDVEDLPSPAPFDGVRVDIVGADWAVIATVSAPFSEGKATLTLPASFDSEELCKAARDAYNDYTGYWPAESVSDRETRVAGFEGGNIIATRGGEAVGRLFLSDWSGEPLDRTRRYYINWLYADRAVTFSGANLRRSGQPVSFMHDAAFESGWGVYAAVTYYDGSPVLRTTAIPDGLALRWRFEAWPGGASNAAPGGAKIAPGKILNNL